MCGIVCRRIAYRMARCGGIARRRIACRQSRRVRYRRSPDTAGGMVVTCGIARRRIACRIARRSMTFRRVRSCLSPDHVSSHPGPPRRPHVSAMLTVRRTARPSSAMLRPNMALSPTPPTAAYEHIFFCLAVALYGGTFGGAAKRNRWAAQVMPPRCNAR